MSLALRFALEVAALGAVGAWVRKALGPPWGSLAALSTAGVLMTLWALAVHGPRTPRSVSLLLQILALILAATSVASLWGGPAGTAFAVVALVNAGMLTGWPVAANRERGRR
jgi:hypothetical protein